MSLQLYKKMINKVKIGNELFQTITNHLIVRFQPIIRIQLTKQ